MKMPSFVLGAALLFWGWQCDHWLFAIPLAIILEAARFLPATRFELSATEFNRVWKLCLLALIIVLAIPYISNKGLGSIYIVMQWLPLVMSPMAIARLYSTEAGVPAPAFKIFYREEKRKPAGEPEARVDFLFPYFAVCLFGACAVAQKTVWFYWGLCALMAWALVTNRPRRFSVAAFMVSFNALIALGYWGGIGLYDLRNYVDAQVVDWLAKRFEADPDPFKARTAIGEIIELKMDDAILYQVGYSKGRLRKILLPQAAYTVYKSSAWYAPGYAFEPVQPVPGMENDWHFETHRDPDRILTVSMRLKKGKGLLLAPNSSYRFSKLPVLYMQHNSLGTVRVDKGPDFVEYHAALHPESSRNGPPDDKDLRVPEELQPTLQAIAEELQLSTKTPEEILRTVEQYFENNFFYSLKLEREDNRLAPLVDFLIHTRKGHCEYFATATTLLLRQAGIPARYVFGYSAHEPNWLQNNLVVRTRDAHAWSIANVNGRWRNVDNTPSVWIDRQEEKASIFEGLFDLFSQIGFWFSYVRWGMEDGAFQTYLVYMLIPPVLFLVWRIYSRARRAQNLARGALGDSAGGLYRKVESDFHRIEHQLEQLGFVREEWETYRRWLGRIQKEHPDAPVTGLQDAVDLHSRLRYDPQGLTPEEQSRLQADIQTWLNAPR